MRSFDVWLVVSQYNNILLTILLSDLICSSDINLQIDESRYIRNKNSVSVESLDQYWGIDTNDIDDLTSNTLHG